MTQQPGGSGPDLIGEFQRWLIRSSARGMGRQVSGQIRTALGRNQQPTGDVWETATTEPPDEAPECAWCPLCRAARLLRETKPGRDTRVTAVSDALGTVVQDAFSVLDAALATTGRAAGGDGRRGGSAGPARSGPAKTAPAKTGSAKTGPAKTGPAKTGPAKTGPAQTRQAQASPAQSRPAEDWPGTDRTGRQARPTAQQPAHRTGAAQSVPEATGNGKRAAAEQAGGTGPAAEHGRDNGHGTAKPGPGDESGAAGQGPGGEPAPDPPKGPRMSLTIGIDVGGTKVAAGVVDDQGRIVEKLRRSPRPRARSLPPRSSPRRPPSCSAGTRSAPWAWARPGS